MRIFIMHIIKLLLIMAFTACFANSYFASEFMGVSDAKKKWGVSDFKPKEFKTSSEKIKGAMATNAIEKQVYVGQDMLNVRKDMGTPDSYFFSDTIYAYKITEPDKDKESWHLVFIPDREIKKVKEVKIHKKCCYKLPF